MGGIKYFTIIFFMSVFVILYVWQNIEVVKMEIEFRNYKSRERQLVEDNDRLLYEIERYRRMDVIQEYARKRGLRKILPRDFEVLVIDKTNAK